MKTHELVIQGKIYEVRSDSGEGPMQEVARMVNERMEQARLAGAPLGQIPVLAALNLAGELLEERSRQADFRSAARERVREMEQLIEDTLNQVVRGHSE